MCYILIMRGWDSEHMSYNNENIQAIICIDKSNIATFLKHLGVLRRFHTTHLITTLPFFLYRKYWRGFNLIKCKVLFVYGKNDK